MTKIVLDTSVLSAFINIGRLKLLKKLLSGHEVYIPDTVYREIGNRLGDAVSFKSGKQGDSWISIVKVKLSRQAGNLDEGEQGVLNLALKMNAIAVMDDRDARRHAKEKGVQYTGTLAMLKRAAMKKMLSKKELEKIVVDLKEKDRFRMNEELEKWLLE
ncbi:MAG: hypothetical protein FJY77_03835 [Candidatus Altiarchaeales archaeon]|nr:hypothetical protein [Candidatus Altiarchaeales archaeon]